MFRCSGCGVCCHHIDKAVELIKDIEVFSFPYGWDESGKCDKLGDDNKCQVYEDRPLMCNLDKVIEVFDLDRETFYEANAKACNEMMDAENIDKSFRL